MTIAELRNILNAAENDELSIDVMTDNGPVSIEKGTLTIDGQGDTTSIRLDLE